LEWSDLLVALALVLVIEGLMPFVSPQRFKQSMRQILSLSNSTVRNMGGVSMFIGVLMLYVVRL